MAIDFDGGDDYIEVTDNDTLDPRTGAFTVMFWHKPNAAAGNSQVMFKYAASNNAWYIQNIYDGDDNLTAGFRGPGGNEDLGNAASGLDMRDGEWYHCALVRPVNGAGNVIYYINGVSKATVARINNNDVNPATNLKIGVYNTAFFKGIIANLVIVKRALTLPEIKSEMYRSWMPDINTSAVWRMDEGVMNDVPGGKDIADISGNGNHGVCDASMGDEDFVAGPPITPLLE